MRKFSQKYVVVHLITALPDGSEYPMEDWPLHVTLADVFKVHASPAELVGELDERLGTFSPIKAEVVGEDWFGDDRTIHVMTLEHTAKLQELHQKIIEVLGRRGVVFNSPEYTNQGFVPHSTVQKTERLESGEVVLFDSVTLIDLFPDQDPRRRRVVATIHLNASLIASNNSDVPG
ncbi:MAG: 2'-5' RNA ligase family protein [Candidatus Saccharibacteria bacterium]